MEITKGQAYETINTMANAIALISRTAVKIAGNEVALPEGDVEQVPTLVAAKLQQKMQSLGQ